MTGVLRTLCGLAVVLVSASLPSQNPDMPPKIAILAYQRFSAGTVPDAMTVRTSQLEAIEQTGLFDWTTVVALRSGASVRVESFDGMVQQGQFLRADTDHLTVTVARRPVDIRRAEVRRLYQMSERKFGRFALRGLVIGATGGATLGAVAAETNKAQWSALMALGWGAIGAVIGAINGLNRDGVLVYEAQAPKSN